MNINATTPNNDPSATRVVDDKAISTPLTDETLWWMARESSAYVLCQKLERKVVLLQREVVLLSSQPWPVLNERDELRHKVEELEKQKEAVKAHVDHQAQIFAWHLSDREKINERLTKTNTVLTGTIDELRSNLNSYEVTLSSYKVRVRELSAQVEQAPFSLQQLKKDRADALAVEKSLRDENTVLRDTLRETTRQVFESDRILVKLRQDMGEAARRRDRQMGDILRAVKEVTK